MAKGKVYLIGAGPGQADLISVRGLNILKQAEVIIYDYLIDKSLLNDLLPGAELICKFGHAQEKINQLLVKFALAGKKVVRLKNGDTAIFSRLSQELKVLHEHKIAFEIVPGITAASAAAAYTGIPLTDHSLSHNVVFVTGHDLAADWSKIAALDTIVLYMAVANLKRIAAMLIKAGKVASTPALIISKAGTIHQKTLKTSLAKITAGVKIAPPAIVIIGQVVTFENNFNWLHKNKRILFTGLSAERFFLKGTYFHLPMIEIKPLADYSHLDRSLKQLPIYNWLVFASRYGVEYFFKRLFALGLDGRSLSGLKIAVTGQSTSRRLLDYGIRADVVPKLESATGLAAALRKQKIAGQKIFMPRSDLSDKGLQIKLEKIGTKVVSAVAYRNVMPQNLPDLDLAFFDEIMFTSPSTVRNFKKRYGRPPAKIKITSIGKTTRTVVKEVFKT